MAFGEVAGGIAAIGSAIAGTASAASQVAKNKRQYKWTDKLNDSNNARARENAQWQLDQQRKLLEEQRKYDSPAAQMQRMKQAGLNPNLIYGQMSDGSAPVDAPQPDTPSDQFQLTGSQSWAGVSSSFSSAAASLMQLTKLNSEIENIDADTANKQENTKGQNIDNETKGEKNVAEITKINSDIKVNQEQENKIHKESKILDYNLKEILPQNQEKLKKEIDKLTEEINQLQQLTPQMVKEYSAKIGMMIANAHLSISQRAKVEKEVARYDSYMDTVLKLNSKQADELHQRGVMEELQNGVFDDIVETMYREYDTHNSSSQPDSKNRAGHKLPNSLEMIYLMNMLSIISKIKP